jgi:hypothetical protein
MAGAKFDNGEAVAERHENVIYRRRHRGDLWRREPSKQEQQAEASEELPLADEEEAKIEVLNIFL